jgi:hypothetical protein
MAGVIFVAISGVDPIADPVASDPDGGGARDLWLQQGVTAEDWTDAP